MIKLYVFIFISFLITLSSFAQYKNIDFEITKKINSIDNNFTRGMVNFGNYSGYITPIAVPAILFSYGMIANNPKLSRDAIGIGLGSVIGVGSAAIIKLLTNRERPYEKYPNDINKFKDASMSSFPSGHTAATFALATSLSIYYPKWYVIVPSFLYAGIVGYSRINAGVHYSSDVIVGALLGVGSAYLGYYINKAMFKKYDEKQFRIKLINITL